MKSLQLSCPPRPPKGTRFGGRAKGTPNKVGAGVREAIQKAFEAVGGADYLVKLANEDPKTFVPLLAKLIPAEMKTEVSGAEGGPLLKYAQINSVGNKWTGDRPVNRFSTVLKLIGVS